MQMLSVVRWCSFTVDDDEKVMWGKRRKEKKLVMEKEGLAKQCEEKNLSMRVKMIGGAGFSGCEKKVDVFAG